MRGTYCCNMISNVLGIWELVIYSTMPNKVGGFTEQNVYLGILITQNYIQHGSIGRSIA